MGSRLVVSEGVSVVWRDGVFPSGPAGISGGRMRQLRSGTAIQFDVGPGDFSFNALFAYP
eukprot:NODE_5119_length_323_cov_95.722628_g4508_i0.p3 GENE.NODE_5119_length_323_cov_95.722628_g4508_i0~~NODE_5119_length_323_cov_95.722628_g4508_i0.p3  ORF type:complete len:60 (-),score=9.72 NODE_5119_length_323_cov_95.722628_g4508_i0:113-292(-)